LLYKRDAALTPFTMSEWTERVPERTDAQRWTIRSPSVAGLRGPVSGSARFSPAAVDWQPSEEAGFWVKPLFEDVARGEKTLLMKVDPGAFSPMHSHPGELEQIYVLEGSFYDQDATIRAGEYCCRAPGAAHEAGSHEGAIVLLIYTKR
jgi:quercetin dioxygenase-like cupin family protein